MSISLVLALTLVVSTLLTALPARAGGLAPLVDAAWLARNLDRVIVLDVRDDDGSFRDEGRIPGSRLVRWSEVRGQAVEDGEQLQDMLPEREAFADMMRRSGVGRDSAIVVSSRGLRPEEMFLATRLYWQIKYFGHDTIAVLNGGTGAWSSQGQPLATGPEAVPARGDWIALAERREMLAETADVVRAVAQRRPLLADSRAMDQYLGLVRNPDRVERFGHIMGARHADARYFILPAKPVLFRPLEELREIAAGLRLDVAAPVIAYCDTGDWASGTWFVLYELLGNRQASLYDGSMHAWTRRPERATIRFKLE